MGGSVQSLLIKNHSQNDVTLYLYHQYDVFYAISREKLEIPAGKRAIKQTHLQYQLYRGGERLQDPSTLKQDTVATISDSLRRPLVIETVSSQDSYPEELELMKQFGEFVEENSVNGMIDLYAVLGVGMYEVRPLSHKEQTKRIHDAYGYHVEFVEMAKKEGSESNPEIMGLIEEAFKTLEIRSTRIKYHNDFDYQQPGAFIGSVFWPEVVERRVFQEEADESLPI